VSLKKKVFILRNKCRNFKKKTIYEITIYEIWSWGASDSSVASKG